MFYRAIIVCLLLNANPASAMNHSDADHNSHRTHSAESVFESVLLGNLTLSDFKARASIGAMKNSAAYGMIEIKSGTDRLVSTTSSVAERVELHEHLNDNGVMRMREVEGGFKVSEDAPVMMKPGGYHIMLINLVNPLKAGSEIALGLTFASGQSVTIKVPVVPIQRMMHH